MEVPGPCAIARPALKAAVINKQEIRIIRPLHPLKRISRNICATPANDHDVRLARIFQRSEIRCDLGAEREYRASALRFRVDARAGTGQSEAFAQSAVRGKHLAGP